MSITGAANTQVTLALQPHGQNGTREVTLTREKIDFNPVSSQLCSSSSSDGSSSNGKTGYIRLATFNKQTPERARTALQKLKADGADRCACCS